ncbi:hypothetical protein DPEC_G00111590 [Dallia pectoralis]|uniref:Uncharacterized protein n=1 Tax=Dallia pectoralis TaxID=75939 RepID=A0ACC2GT33_DALPE|nr:hypothetical protein DPEC_G00111590 [Dallia pectoralis]
MYRVRPCLRPPVPRFFILPGVFGRRSQAGDSASAASANLEHSCSTEPSHQGLVYCSLPEQRVDSVPARPRFTQLHSAATAQHSSGATESTALSTRRNSAA